MKPGLFCRLWLAAYLALWTPAWCCCALKSAVCSLTGASSHVCGSGGCCLAEAAEKTVRAAEPACCATEAVAPAAASEESNPSGTTCMCREIGEDLARMDTGGRAVLPVLPVLHFTADSPAVAALADDGPITLRPPPRLDLPPPTTLLAQRCLLTI